MERRFKKRILVLLLTGITLVGFFSAAWIVLFTHFGSAYVAKKIFNSFSETDKIVWKKNEGALISGMSYKDIALKDLKWFPLPNELKIQELKIDVNSFSLDGIELFVNNARLVLPNADPVFLSGKIEKQLMDFNLFTNSVTDSEIKGFFEKGILNELRGSLTGVDVFIKGAIDEPKLSGGFVVERIAKDGFSLEQAPCVFDVTLKNVDSTVAIYGSLTINEGLIKGNKTALVRLQESKIFFNGDPAKPSFNIKATSMVEKIKMNIVLSGDFIKPDLQITSDPPLPQERLLLALATNKTWKNTEEGFSKGEISPELAGDFIGYFLSGGESNSFAEKFGLKSLSVKYGGQAKGVAVTKDFLDNLEGRYEIEENKQDTGNPSISQKVGGEYKLTEHVAVGAEKEIKGKEKADAFADEINKTQANDKVYLKYKKAF